MVWLNSRESGSETILRTTRKTVCPETDFSVPGDATLPAAPTSGAILPLLSRTDFDLKLRVYLRRRAGRITRWLHYCASAFRYYVMGSDFKPVRQNCRNEKRNAAKSFACRKRKSGHFFLPPSLLPPPPPSPTKAQRPDKTASVEYIFARLCLKLNFLSRRIYFKSR